MTRCSDLPILTRFLLRRSLPLHATIVVALSAGQLRSFILVASQSLELASSLGWRTASNRLHSAALPSHSVFRRTGKLFNLSSDLLKHLLSLEKLEDHDLSFTFIKIDFTLGKFGLPCLLIRVLLGDLPRSQPSHQLGVVIVLLHNDRALSLEKTSKLLRDVLGRLDMFLTIELVLELASFFEFLFSHVQLLLHEEILSLLLKSVSAVKRLKLALQVLKESFLLVCSQTLILVALLDLLLALFDTSSQICCIFI